MKYKGITQDVQGPDMVLRFSCEAGGAFAKPAVWA